jgi:hypothetical protein
VPVSSIGRRVRILWVEEDMSLSEPELVDILQHVSLYQPGLRIFPRLQRLYWTTVNHPDLLPYIYMFLQSSLTALTFHYESDQEPIEHELESVFHLIGHECRDLRHLNLHRDDGRGPSMAGEAIGIALSGLATCVCFCLRRTR